MNKGTVQVIDKIDSINYRMNLKFNFLIASLVIGFLLLTVLLYSKF